MLDKLKAKFSSYYQDHPKTTIGAGVLLGITLVVIIAFGANSTLFQGNLGATDLKVNNGTDRIVAGEADPGLSDKLEVISPTDRIEILPGAEDRLSDLIADKSDVDEEGSRQATDFSLADAAIDPIVDTDVTNPEVNLGIDDAVNQSAVIPGSSDTTDTEDNQQVANAVDRPPVAENVVINANNLEVGTILTGEYDYTDVDGDAETSSTYRWLRADSESDAPTATAIISKSYPLTAADAGKYLSFEVIPINENAAGDAIRSDLVGPVVGTISSPPFGTEVEIIGEPTVGAPLLGIYQFNDPEDDSEAESQLTWYRVTEGVAEIAAEGSDIYEVTEADLGSEIVFGYLPIAAVEETNGEEVLSDSIGPITAAVTSEDEILVIGEDTTANDDDEILIDEQPDDPSINDDLFVDQDQFTETQADPEPQVVVNQPVNTGTATPAANTGSEFSLTSNTNANLLSAAQVQGDTGPEAILILPLLGAFGFGVGRKLAKRK